VSFQPIQAPRGFSRRQGRDRRRPLRIVLLWLAAVFFLLPGFARASTIAYDNDTSLGDVGSLQNFPGVLGLDFNVNQAITVTALGAYDQGLPANLDGVNGGGVVVGIFDRNTGLLVSPTASFSSSSPGVQINGDAFQSESFLLLPGQYSVVTYNDKNYNEGFVSTTFNPTSVENSGGGAISFVGSGRYDNTSAFQFPTTIDSGPTNRYDAGTFAFVTSPEPSSFILLLSAVVAGLVPLRRHKKGKSLG
jgi:hypothetical protein